MSFTLPNLKYAFDALEKSIDAQTMEIHHDKHHQAYVDKLNEAISKYPELTSHSIDELMRDLENLPEDIRNAVRNNGGGHWNHSFFWEILSPENTQTPVELEEEFMKTFGSVDSFKEQFKNAGLARFGSGWVWLVKKNDGSLSITSTPNQDNPLMPFAEVQGKPILGLDVWEHAYYLKYQNRRADYIDAFLSVVNWEKVYEFFKAN
jgi:Fe-Mn family superoxide dismutase